MSVRPLTKSILLLGDSITEQGTIAGGYSQLLAAAYIRKLDVVNRGLGGYNSVWLYEVAKQIVGEKGAKDLSEVALVIVMIGANDSVNAKRNPRQHVRYFYREKIAQILALFPPETPKILITPPPVQPERFAANIRQWVQMLSPEVLEKWKHRFTDVNAAIPEREESVTESYAKAVLELGQKLEVPVVDLFEEFAKVPKEDWDRLFTDGLHLTPAGYQLVYARLISVIKTKYPHLDPETLALVFPGWEDHVVDLSDIEDGLKLQA